MLKTLSARDSFVEQTQYLPEPILKLVTPVLIATLSATLAYLGWTQISRGIVGRSFLARQKRNYGVETSVYFPELDSRDGRHTSRVEVKSTFVQICQLLLSFGAAFVIAMLLTTSLEISLAVSLLVTAIPFFVAKRGVEKSNRARELAWPIAIDSLISSLQAGESITEAVQNLASHGPEELAPAFARVKTKMEGGESLEASLLSEMRTLDSSASDQTLSTLLIAKEFGGRDVTVTLRLLSSFLRDDFEAQEEIKTKFGWIRNSALLGAAAPWLILLLLSAQKDTVAAYQSSAGKTVLSIGVIATAVAFIWMERVARIPAAARPLRI